MAKPVRSVERVVNILIYLNKFNGSNSNQVAMGTGLSRGTAYRMLETLRQEGLIDQVGADSRYWLTRKVRQLSNGFEEEDWISTIARPEMERLTKIIAWPVMLMTPAGINMILRATTDSQTTLVFKRYNVGHFVPMLGSAAGPCYLAFLPKARLSTILEVIRRTGPDAEAEIARNKSAVAQMLGRIRKEGVSVAESLDRTSTHLSVPILISGEARAILGMRHFKSAMSRSESIERFLRPLQEAAAQIGMQWHTEHDK
jgi:IclR family transcriptional regulator, mhp operon transcriptional activator